MLVAYVPALCAVIGALAYALSANGKIQELGRLTMTLASRTLHLG